MLRTRIVFWVILYCIRYRANPWRYFQLNAPWFNENKGIYSKLDIDEGIPLRWRLKQIRVDNHHQPTDFPVFLKPEWGQNSHGIMRADNRQQWKKYARLASTSNAYIVQEAAPGEREFEIFYVRTAASPGDFAILSVTEVLNNESTPYPINGIHNPATYYLDRSGQFNNHQRQQLWSMIALAGEFKIARVCGRCGSIEALLDGDFKIVEINLFVPMPLVLLDQNITPGEKRRFIHSMADNLAQLIKSIPSDQPYRPIFFRKWSRHRKIAR